MLGGTWEASAAAAVILTLALTPLVRRLALAHGLVDQPSGRKIHAEPIPYLGGAAIAAGVLLGIFVGPRVTGSVVVVVIAATALVLTGLVDDRSSLGAGSRLLVQAAAAVAAVAAGVRMRVTGVEILDALITCVVLVAVINAFNMLDNMDGLSAGISLVSSVAIAIGATWTGQEIVAAASAAIAAAAWGFLAFNAGTASIFMGDAGSTFLGFMVGVSVIELDPVGISRPQSLLIAWLLLLVPFLDICTVIVSRKLRGAPVMSAGTDHLSHRLVRHGYSRSTSVAILALGQAVAVTAALILMPG